MLGVFWTYECDDHGLGPDSNHSTRLHVMYLNACQI